MIIATLVAVLLRGKDMDVKLQVSEGMLEHLV